MHTYPADGRYISDVERGRICDVIVPLHAGGPPRAGDSVLFALSASRAGRPPCYVRGGDSVLVQLTGATELEATDPTTGRGLLRLTWEPLGRDMPRATTPSRGEKSRPSRGAS